MKIAVDAMGSDSAPGPEIEGTVRAVAERGVEVILVGDEAKLKPLLEKESYPRERIEIVHAGDVIKMDESPSVALRKKTDNSMRLSFDLVKQGRAGAVVGAGNSGAMMAMSIFNLGRLPGIERPAIIAVLPTIHGRMVALDVGANVECKPIHLAQFALMGSIYARFTLGKENPAVGLLSNGEEEKKGTDLTRDTHAILKGLKLNYIGYVEGSDVYKGKADVLVCDGFTGNVLLKVSESLAEATQVMIREEVDKSIVNKFGMLLALSALRRFKKRVDYAEIGGAPLIGVNGLSIICHGRSTGYAVKNAIFRAHEFVENRINEKIVQELRTAGLEKSPGE
jgi:glycerol-3-phosphate acyltransferase PlsX